MRLNDRPRLPCLIEELQSFQDSASRSFVRLSSFFIFLSRGVVVGCRCVSALCCCDTHTMTTPSTAPQRQALEDALTQLLEHNFDADSKVAILTLLKLLDNLLQHPSDPKVRSIRLGNAAFHQKVGSRPGGVAFLLACGFERQAAVAGGIFEQPERLVLPEDDSWQSHWIAARRLLATKAVQELGMSADDLPPYRPPPVLSSNIPFSGASATTFDPYAGQRFDAKSAAVGTNLGPDGNYVSTTERQLEQLQKKQATLEAKLQRRDLDRDWVAQRPGETAIVVPPSVAPTTTSDSALVAQRLQKQQAERQQREHGGFTTKAMRDLAKLQTQKVYSHVPITIQFPDGIKVTGKFLPKERIQDVKDAFGECLETVAVDFDLYVTPPRRLLDVRQTLQEEGLVPAAKVFVSWKTSPAPAVKESLFQTSASTQAFPKAQALGQDDDAKKPTAEKVNKTKPDREAALLQRMMGGRSGGLGGAPSKDATKKPKWFKG